MYSSAADPSKKNYKYGFPIADVSWAFGRLYQHKRVSAGHPSIASDVPGRLDGLGHFKKKNNHVSQVSHFVIYLAMKYTTQD